MKLRMLLPASAALVMFLGACNPDDADIPLPGPVAMTEEALGHYCNMNVLEHDGPKAQVHLVGFEHPIWFTQVRDAIAFMRSPEELYDVRVIYVHDISRAESWADPGDDAWINAEEAVFAIGSLRTGGMGAPEAIPFGTREAAANFIEEHGGAAVSLSEIPDRYVLGPVDLSSGQTSHLEFNQ